MLRKLSKDSVSTVVLWTRRGVGSLIACDASGCLIKWYHIECVGLTLETMPDEDDGWICPPCKLAEKETEK